MTISTIIADLATTCAAEHRRQGWEGGGSSYDVGVFHGDAEALADALGRKPAREELRTFESAVRAVLNGFSAAEVVS